MKTKMFSIGLLLGAVALAVVAFNVGMAEAAPTVFGIGASGLLLFGMATARESTFYTNTFTNQYLQDNRKYDGRFMILPIEITIVSAAATGDSYKATQIPANARVEALSLVTDGLGASAGAVTVTVGDSGSSTRYGASTNMGATGNRMTLAVAGQGYTPTADTTVIVTITGTPTVGKVIKGHMLVTPGY